MIDSERRHALVLRAWEATNIERDLRSVMGAVADVLSPLVPMDGMGIVVWSGTFPTGGPPRLLDIHVAGGLPNEKVDEILRDADKPVSGAAGPAHRSPMMNRFFGTCRRVFHIRALIFSPKPTWYEHERRSGCRRDPGIHIRADESARSIDWDGGFLETYAGGIRSGSAVLAHRCFASFSRSRHKRTCE